MRRGCCAEATTIKRNSTWIRLLADCWLFTCCLAVHVVQGQLVVIFINRKQLTFSVRSRSTVRADCRALLTFTVLCVAAAGWLVVKVSVRAAVLSEYNLGCIVPLCNAWEPCRSHSAVRAMQLQFRAACVTRRQPFSQHLMFGVCTLVLSATMAAALLQALPRARLHAVTCSLHFNGTALLALHDSYGHHHIVWCMISSNKQLQFLCLYSTHPSLEISSFFDLRFQLGDRHELSTPSVLSSLEISLPGCRYACFADNTDTVSQATLWWTSFVVCSPCGVLAYSTLLMIKMLLLV